MVIEKWRWQGGGLTCLAGMAMMCEDVSGHSGWLIFWLFPVPAYIDGRRDAVICLGMLWGW
jgi:hypothetical protein